MNFLYIIIGIGILMKVLSFAGKQDGAEAPSPRRAAAAGGVDDEDTVAHDDWMAGFEEEDTRMETDAYEQAAFQQSYFTYEDEPTYQRSVAAAAPMAPAAAEVADSMGGGLPVMRDFDLRQAFIYQTILNRVEC